MDEKKQSFSERNAVILKMALISGLMLLLLIPQFMVMGMIEDRQATRNQAVAEVSDKWGGSQTLAGPVLTIPYQEFHKEKYETVDKDKDGDPIKDKNGNVIRTVKWNEVRTVKYLHFLPEELNLKAQADPEIRYRGIFHVVLYRLGLSNKGTFHIPPMAALGVPSSDVLWGQAFLAVGISDLRGIQQDIPLTWNGRSLVFQPGVNGLSALPSGMYASVPLGPSQRSVDYSFDLKLNGSGQLSFVPTGKTTTVHLESGWASPSFNGNILPQTHQVGDKGFSADWKTFYMSRSFPQVWRGGDVEWGALEGAAFGTSFLYPVDAYQQVTRSAKYGALYILLTFGVFFLFEILAGLRVHSVQYIFVGFAIILFYLLLLSLSEYMGFEVAYGLACSGIIGLLTGYSRSVLCDWKKAGVIGFLMSVLYGILYVLLQSEDHALLFGSVGLFVALATAMYVTRNVDWYEVGRKSMGSKR